MEKMRRTTFYGFVVTVTVSTYPHHLLPLHYISTPDCWEDQNTDKHTIQQF